MPEKDIALSSDALSDFYTGYFGYYKTLEQDAAKKFISRCRRFIGEKEITGENGFTVDNRVRAIIAASAVQLTLGLETWRLDFFGEIRVHASDFKDRTGRISYSGETNLGGVISLSWARFIFGYKVVNDNINLGLHEFSHALRFNSFRGYSQDYFVDHYFDSWFAAASEAFSHLRQGKKTIFRAYGGENLNEFISVCIEHYFESPEEIRENYPQLYFSTAILLNQVTENSHTRLEVRNEMLEQKNELLKGFSGFSFQSAFMGSESFRIIMIVSAVYLFTAIITGIASGPGLIIFGILALLYLRFDFRFTRLNIRNKEFSVEKGLLLFRRRRKWKMRISQLISMRFSSPEEKRKTLLVVFFNLSNGYFYEEEMGAGNSDTAVLEKELAINKVAVLK